MGCKLMVVELSDGCMGGAFFYFCHFYVHLKLYVVKKN